MSGVGHSRNDSIPLWTGASGRALVRFLGRSPKMTRSAALGTIDGAPTEASWLRQVHSSTVLEARSSCAGEGDGLVTRQPDLALSISTADCVPVVIATESAIGAAHAGWRGIVSGVVASTVESLAADGLAEAVAWIGPAIGPCCYEVGPDVADRVVAAADSSAQVAGPSTKPHLDLQEAVRTQLRRAGLDTVEVVRVCTRCRPELLWSYRRDGERAGRNLTFVWLTG